MKVVGHHAVRNAAAFTTFLLLALFAFWLWHSADFASDNKTAGLARVTAVLLAVVSACFLGLAPVLRCARLPIVMFIAAIPMGALIFTGVWIGMLLLTEVVFSIYDRERRVPPDWLGAICLYAATLIALMVSIYYVYRDLKRGSNKRDGANGLPPTALH